MSKNHILTVIVATSLSFLAPGCGKQETETTPPATPAESTTGQAGSDLKDAAKAVQDQAKTAVSAVSQSANQAAADLQKQATAAGAEADSMLAQAKSFVTDGKYQEALGTLKQVSNLKLTSEQQKVLQDLQKQVQAGLASLGATNAAQKLGGFLGGKK